jgi:deoxyribodipyrimidine photo-lyase
VPPPNCTRRAFRATLRGMTTIIWFRQDLRVSDNPALAAALAGGAPVVPVYILAADEEGIWRPGGASRWWLHHSLKRLDEELRARGSRLILRRGGDSLGELQALARSCGAVRVVWNRRYEPAAIARDRIVKATLRERGIDTESYNGALLHEPWTVKTKAGGPFQVFTPFWRHCTALEDPPEPIPAPSDIPAPSRWPKTASLDELRLLPRVNWTQGMHEAWTPGSTAARGLLDHFLEESFDDYGTRRDQPGVAGTSRLSPYLHFGNIGPREIWHATRRHALQRGRHTTWRTSQFLTEVGWREFAHHLLYHFPKTPEQPLRANYARFPWKLDESAEAAWTRGATGYPIVDAGMRELWRTGWMHNRVRMIAASFLIKDLLIDWTHGARWFWDTLVDADLASNTLGWQWVAGCGADAAPFFRIFNPTSQGTKFDPLGIYVRRWIPELGGLPNQWIHEPWSAPAQVLAAAGIKLGEHYPRPIVQHNEARLEALKALSAVTHRPAGEPKN